MRITFPQGGLSFFMSIGNFHGGEMASFEFSWNDTISYGIMTERKNIFRLNGRKFGGNK